MFNTLNLPLMGYILASPSVPTEGSSRDEHVEPPLRPREHLLDLRRGLRRRGRVGHDHQQLGVDVFSFGGLVLRDQRPREEIVGLELLGRYLDTLPSPADAPYSGLPPSGMFVTSFPDAASITVDECASPLSENTRFDGAS